MSDLAQLFQIDPLNLTDQDLDEIIKGFRASRHLFQAGNMKAGSTKPKTEKQQKLDALKDKLDINLGSL